MGKKVFQFRVQNISYGWCRVLMLINDKEISYNAGYLGDHPLNTFVDACLEYLVDYVSPDDSDYYIKWLAEPGQMDTKLHLDGNNQLSLDLKDQDDEGKITYEEWHEVIPFNDFVSAIISEGFRVLNAFGLYGYRSSWCGQTDFPLASLLRITGELSEDRFEISEYFFSNLSKEIECLQEHISKLEITKETKMNECKIYYESWQLQCCGDPFSVGDKVEWTCIMPREFNNAHGIIIDFEEEHHGFATHSIVGTVSKIIAERSEFPKGERVVWYHKAYTIQEELTHADGWETNYKDDETTDRTFWGYIVTLKDVTEKPLNNRQQ